MAIRSEAARCLKTCRNQLVSIVIASAIWAVGPDLSGIGRRFSRIHLIESILDPSRSVAPSYATIAVVLNSGRILTGVPISKDDESMVIGDNQGKLHQIALDDVDQVSQQDTSIMPEGLDEKLTEREFADLLAFLESLKAEK